MKPYFKLAVFLLVAAHPVFFATLLAQSPSPYVISGDVQDGTGHGAAEVRVCAFTTEPDRDVLCAKSDAEGRFNLRLEKAGKYILIPEKVSDGYISQYLSFYRAPAASITNVVVNNGNPHPFVSLLLGPKNGVLSGSIMDSATGLPVENMSFTLCHQAAQGDCYVTSAKSAEGKFRVAAPHVPFTLKITADGYEEWFGMSGTEKEGALYIASGTTMELSVYLKRRLDAEGRALSEAEKQEGVNLPSPLQLSPDNEVVLDYFPRATKLEWSAVEGALSYAVEVDYCRGGEKDGRTCFNPQPHTVRGNPLMSGILETKYEFQFIGAQPGRWRVWAIDKDGRAGFKSPWRTFFYLK